MRPPSFREAHQDAGNEEAAVAPGDERLRAPAETSSGAFAPAHRGPSPSRHRGVSYPVAGPSRVTPDALRSLDADPPGRLRGLRGRPRLRHALRACWLPKGPEEYRPWGGSGVRSWVDLDHPPRRTRPGRPDTPS